MRDLTNVAFTIASQLQCDIESTDKVSKSAEQAFAEFIALSMHTMKEPERSIRQNKIFHVLTAPLQELL